MCCVILAELMKKNLFFRELHGQYNCQRDREKEREKKTICYRALAFQFSPTTTAIINTSMWNTMHTDTQAKAFYSNYNVETTEKHPLSITVLLYPNWPHSFPNERMNEPTYVRTNEKKMHRIAFSTTIPFPQHEISITFHWICTQKYKTSAECR